MGYNYFALNVEEIAEKQFERTVIEKNTDSLPQADVLIKVEYSSLNYKDALSSSGHKGITRRFPHTPGIDASGVVVESNSDKFKEGDKVICTGYDLGMNTSGGFGGFIRVSADWVVKLPESMTLRESMIYGTAGFTAATGIYEIISNGISPDMGQVLVSGASGGVGTMAVAMLSKLGYEVVASSGKPEKNQFLYDLGAKEIISREEVNDASQKGLLPPRWIAAIDNVGGNTLSTILRQAKDRAVITNCGMVESTLINTFVFPFILRGVRLIGIASAETPMNQRLTLWDKIENVYRLDDKIEKYVKEVGLNQLSEEIDLMLKGQQAGRILLNHNIK